MNKNEFRCAMCGGVFEKGNSDEEALEELNGNFPNIDIDDCELVCEDCYNKMIEEYPIKTFYNDLEKKRRN